MQDSETPIFLSQVEPGMRLSLSAAYALNPSMASMAKRHTPVACQVLHVMTLKNGGYRIEAVDHKLYQFKRDQQVTRLIAVVTSLDNLKPAAPSRAMTFNHVSIE